MKRAALVVVGTLLLSGCGGGDGAALRVAHHNDQLGAYDGAAVLHAAKHLGAGDVAGDADAEDVAESEVEDDFRRGAGVDATENDGQRVLTAGGVPAQTGLAAPPSDSGVLGPDVDPDGLTITVSVGASLFDGRYGLAGRKPAKLRRMQDFPNDDLDRDRCDGDVLLQLCAHHTDTLLRALREVAHARGVAAGQPLARLARAAGAVLSNLALVLTLGLALLLFRPAVYRSLRQVATCAGAACFRAWRLWRIL